MIAVNCELNRPWKGTGGQCVDLVGLSSSIYEIQKEGPESSKLIRQICKLPRWQFIVSIDIFTEVLLFGLAVALLQGLFMPLKRKVAIGCAFVFRLP